MYKRPLRSDELYHHGILGQKWGVRRYQNPDGSLTPRGKIHRDQAIKESRDWHYWAKNTADSAKKDYDNYKGKQNHSIMASLGEAYLDAKRYEIEKRLYKNAVDSDLLKVGEDYKNFSLTKIGKEKIKDITSSDKVEKILRKEDKGMLDAIRKHNEQSRKDIDELIKYHGYKKGSDEADMLEWEYLDGDIDMNDYRRRR